VHQVVVVGICVADGGFLGFLTFVFPALNRSAPSLGGSAVRRVFAAGRLGAAEAPWTALHRHI
jgi:hypothetical protein